MGNGGIILYTAKGRAQFQQCAGYAGKMLATQSPLLTKRYGRGFGKSSRYRKVCCSQTFTDRDVVAARGHPRNLINSNMLPPVYSDDASAFHIKQTLNARFNVRALRELIGRQNFERREIANARAPRRFALTLDTLSDRYLLGFFGLRDADAARNLEKALIREMESFLVKIDHGWTSGVASSSKCFKCIKTALTQKLANFASARRGFRSRSHRSVDARKNGSRAAHSIRPATARATNE